MKRKIQFKVLQPHSVAVKLKEFRDKHVAVKLKEFREKHVAVKLTEFRNTFKLHCISKIKKMPMVFGWVTFIYLRKSDVYANSMCINI